MIIRVIFMIIFRLFTYGIQAKSLTDGVKQNERDTQTNEEASQVSLFDNSGYSMNYGNGLNYPQMGSLYQTSNYHPELRRSIPDHRTGRRHTGIIYGDGKPIGILQPYQESFKFMPIKEEKVYSFDGGRSNIEQQEPFINLMYPLTRFSRSEDAIRMAEFEAAKAEFLDKRYPSMLVDFKIHNKLHPTGFGSKSTQNFNNLKRSDDKTNQEDAKKKRETPFTGADVQKKQKRESDHPSKREAEHSQKREASEHMEKREIEHPMKRETDHTQKREADHEQKREAEHSEKRETEHSQKRETEQVQKREAEPLQKRETEHSQKREAEHSQKRETDHLQKRENEQRQQKRESGPLAQRETAEKREDKQTSNPEKRQIEMPYLQQIKSEDTKRDTGLVGDSQFDSLKSKIAKRNPQENAQIIEEDLKGLLSDMGLIEDDLEENAEEMGQNINSVVEDEDSEEGFDNANPQKERIAAPLEQKRDNAQKENQLITERKKRAEMNVPVNVEQPVNIKSKENKREVEETMEKHSITKRHDENKAYLDVSFPSKENENKEPSLSVNVIPNKREATIENEIKISKDNKRSPDVSVSTETYEQYEQRVAREIKSKIKQLKEEVKRELGALEDDKEEEDDEDTANEQQRKKRYIINTLMDEETHQIDPNENLDEAELRPHILRKRRMLSNEPMQSFSDAAQKETIDEPNLSDMKLELDSMSESADNFARNQEDLYAKTRLRKANMNPFNINEMMNQNNYRWQEQKQQQSSMYAPSKTRNYINDYAKRNSRKYATVNNNKRNSANELNCEGFSNTDYENDAPNANGEDDENAVSAMVEMAKKNEDVKGNTAARNEHFQNARMNAKKPQGFMGNGKSPYYYFYGNNNNNNNNNGETDNKRENANPSQRVSGQSMYGGYQRMRGVYPGQYHKMQNLMHNSRQYRKDNGNNGRSKLNFKRMYDKAIRKKRHIGQNFLIPSRNMEKAIITNLSPSIRNSSANYYKNQMLKNWKNYHLYRRNFTAAAHKRINNNNNGSRSADQSDYIKGKTEKSNVQVKKNNNQENVSGSKERQWYGHNFQDDLELYKHLLMKKQEAAQNSSLNTKEETAPIDDDYLGNNRKLLFWNKENVTDDYRDYDYNEMMMKIKEIKLNDEVTTETVLSVIKNVTSDGKINNCANLTLRLESVERNNFFVPNKTFSLSGWKRRKRETEHIDETSKGRVKRSNWFWPSLSFFHENDQNDEENQALSGESTDMEKFEGGEKSSFALNNNEETGELEGDFDELSGIDSGGFDREKRQSDLHFFDEAKSRNRRFAESQQLLTEISDAELFGALPQSYEGGLLSRYKRVKRKELI